MLCPYCGFDESNVLESRDAAEGKMTRRRRECLKCNKRFTTYEKIGNIELKVVKKDGRVEDYDREKLERCFEKACWKLNLKPNAKDYVGYGNYSQASNECHFPSFPIVKREKDQHQANALRCTHRPQFHRPRDEPPLERKAATIENSHREKTSPA